MFPDIVNVFESPKHMLICNSKVQVFSTLLIKERYTWTSCVTSAFKNVFVGNLFAKDKAIRGSTEKAVLAYSIHFSELIFCLEVEVSLKANVNSNARNYQSKFHIGTMDVGESVFI